MKVVGIDPSQRHTGLALLDEQVEGGAPLFFEIETRGTDLLTSVQRIRREFASFVSEHIEKDNVAFSMEKMVASGFSSQLLFYVQMALFEEIQKCYPKSEPILINPLPVQLKSYMRRRFQINPEKKSTIVNGFKEKCPVASKFGRVSSHLVEAYFLARMGIEVLEHRWEYTRPQRELPLVPWEVNYGIKYE